MFNTGFFMDKKVTVQTTMSGLEALINKDASFKELGIDGISYMPFEGFIPDFSDEKYKKQFVARFKDRVGFIAKKKTDRGGYDELPEEALESIKKVAEQAEKL